jgi:anti-sigma factor RsiW
MTAIPDPLQLNAYVDGELEPAGALTVEAACAENPAVRTQLEHLLQVRKSVRSQAGYVRAPALLRDRIDAILDLESGKARAAAADRVGAVQARWRRWFVWESYASALAAVAAVALAAHWILLPLENDERVQSEVIASHARAVVSQRLVDVASSDHHTVKPWLSSRLDYSPPVEEPPQSDTQLLGARVDYVDGRPVAALVLRHAGHEVDSFVWPAPGGDTSPAFSQERGFRVARWTRSGMRHWVVSDLNAQEFDALVQRLARGG